MKDPWGYENYRIGSLVVKTIDGEIRVENYVEEGACYAGSPTIMTMDEAINLANFIIKTNAEQKKMLYDSIGSSENGLLILEPEEGALGHSLNVEMEEWAAVKGGITLSQGEDLIALDSNQVEELYIHLKHNR